MSTPGERMSADHEEHWMTVPVVEFEEWQERIKSLEAALRPFADAFDQSRTPAKLREPLSFNDFIRASGVLRRAALSLQEPTGTDEPHCNQCIHGFISPPAPCPLGRCDGSGRLPLKAGYSCACPCKEPCKECGGSERVMRTIWEDKPDRKLTKPCPYCTERVND